MQKILKTKKTIEVSKARNNRPIDIAHSLIPMMTSVNNNQIEAILLHKSLFGYVLITLNARYQPLHAWSDIKGIIPIKCRRVTSSEKFSTIVRSLNPKILYLNDGEVLKSIPSTCTIQAYHNKTLLDILHDLQQKYSQTLDSLAVDNKINSNNIPSYKDMQIMDPSMTRKQYKQFKNKILHQK